MPPEACNGCLVGREGLLGRSRGAGSGSLAGVGPGHEFVWRRSGGVCQEGQPRVERLEGLGGPTQACENLPFPHQGRGDPFSLAGGWCPAVGGEKRFPGGNLVLGPFQAPQRQAAVEEGAGNHVAQGRVRLLAATAERCVE